MSFPINSVHFQWDFLAEDLLTCLWTDDDSLKPWACAGATYVPWDRLVFTFLHWDLVAIVSRRFRIAVIWLSCYRVVEKELVEFCHTVGTWEQTIAWTSKVLQSENKLQKWKATRASNTQHLGTSSKDTEHKDAWCPHRKDLFESYYCYCLQDTESHKGALELAISLGCNFDARLQSLKSQLL